MVRSSIITGVGAYLPEMRLDNDTLAKEKNIDTTDEWIIRRTGIKYRHIAAPEEMTSDLALMAAKRALKRAHLKANDIDLIILATTTPENTFPSSATRLQHKLGITNNCPAFDIQAVCTGFIYGLVQAHNAIMSSQAKRVLLVGSELYSRILDWQDRTTSVLFGDGAGAIILEACHYDDSASSGVLATDIGADGSHYHTLYVDGGVSSTQTAGYVRMNGPEVFRQAVQRMSESVQKTMSQAGLIFNQLDWLVPHQANIRIIDKVGQSLGLPEEKIIITVQEHANISAATIPLALNYGVEHNHFKRNDILALTAMGGGFTWGSVILKWS